MTPEQKSAISKATAIARAIKKAVSKPENEVIASTKDGGRVLRMDDGSMSFTSPGYSTNDQDTIKRIMDGEGIAPIIGESFDRDIIDATPGGMAGGLVAKAGQGAPIVGEFLDEGLQAAGADPRGLRQLQGAMARQHPAASTAASITGGVLASAPVAVAGIGKAAQAATRVGQAGRGIAMGAAAGTAEGAAAGAGRDHANRMRGASEGALIGGTLGGALGGLGVYAAGAVEELSKRVKRLDVRTIGEELGISMPAARVIKSALINDDLDAAQRAIAQAGPDAMLADAGQGSAALLDAATQTGGRALRVTRERVGQRAASSGRGLNSALDRILGDADGLKAAQKDISQRTAAARNAAYERAWQTPLDYTTGGTGEAVLGVLERVPARYLNPAIDAANRRAQMAADGTKSIMASIDDAGRVTFSELPNMRQLHEIKVGLDDIVRQNTDDITGKMSPDAVDASRVAKMLREAIKEASPAYKAATRLGGDKIAEEQALMLGKRLLRTGTTFEDARNILASASVEAKAAAKRGLRQHIEDTLSEVKRTITDGNVDAREAMKLVKDLSGRASMKKVRLVLGTDAKALFDELDKAEASLALRAAVSRNSATAARLSLQDQISSEMQPSLLRRALGKSGNLFDGARELTETLAGIDPRSMSADQQQLMAEVAEALTGIRGADAENALKTIRRAMSGQPIRGAEAAMIGRVVAGSGVGLGYQATAQSLTPSP